MNNEYPEYAVVDGKRYKINTDFRYAIECNRIAEDGTIGDYERSLGIICTLFGAEAIDNPQHYEKLLKIAKNYLLCGNAESDRKKDKKEEENDLDFSKCVGLIKSSFKFDYQYDPYKEKHLHWYEFNNDLFNLSTSEFGTCCALNRILSILNQDARNIKDDKQRKQLVELQRELRRKYCVDKKPKHTKEQRDEVNSILEKLNIRRG